MLAGIMTEHLPYLDALFLAICAYRSFIIVVKDAPHHGKKQDRPFASSREERAGVYPQPEALRT